MKGIIRRFADFNKLNKKVKKAHKKRSHAGSTFRDYRGIEGALDDANKGKKK